MSGIKEPLQVSTPVVCYHCGEDVLELGYTLEEKQFCCQGCKTVFEILNKSELCDYYVLEKNPGISQKQTSRKNKFGFLDDEQVIASLLRFRQDEQCHVVFYLPQMHCSSCIWLLEHLQRVNAGVIKSEVDFLKKEVKVIFDASKTSLRGVAESLTLIGYEPHISLQDLSDKKIKKPNRGKIVKIGLAGFCFGNIMMLSFPEYFSLSDGDEAGLKTLFSALNIALSLPVFFYCAWEFFDSAYRGLRQKFLNIDAPIALAILITFVRSLYEILSGTGPGYLDSMSGIVFFMLLGRFFQNRTYEALSFERDYRSYFPLGVSVLKSDGTESQIAVSKLKVGDRIRIHHGEIVPADSILFMGKANLDYSFVSGESQAIEKSIGEIIYAGGKQVGAAIELEVVREISQSYLTGLWNQDSFKKEKQKPESSFIHLLSRYFTLVLFSIALIATVFWQINDPSKTWQVLTAVLIVACPCALLLSSTFTNGSMLQVLGSKGIYVKNSGVLETMAKIDTLVFDKTGTLTEQNVSSPYYTGRTLEPYEQELIATLAAQSNHPMSRAVLSTLKVSSKLKIRNFHEEKSRGLSALIDGREVRIGNAEWVGQKESESERGARGKQNERGERRNDHSVLASGSLVYISIDGKSPGHFVVQQAYRQELKTVISELSPEFDLALISGDYPGEEEYLRSVFGKKSVLLFRQSPQDKLNFVAKLQHSGKKVLMLGDGLNDAGALKQSDVGVAISDNTNNFSPACDIIFSGSAFRQFAAFLSYCRQQKNIVYASFVLSILYNVVGLYFAVSGELEPVIAAILMPISSVSIVLFTSGSGFLLAKRVLSEKRPSKTAFPGN